MSDSVDFRDVSAALHGAVLDQHKLDLGANRFELVAVSANATVSLVFDGVAAFKWHSAPKTGAAASSGSRSTSNPSIAPSIVGLERLGPTEPWRLYLSLPGGSELELTCARISSGGLDVTGIGRSYRH